MLSHLKELVLGGLAAAGLIYGYKRSKGMPAPPVAPVVPPAPPQPVPVAPPPPAVAPTSTPTTVLVTPPKNTAPTSLGGGVTSTVVAGIDTLTGGLIGQDLTGTNTSGTAGNLGDTSTLLSDVVASSSSTDTSSSSGDGSLSSALDGALASLGIGTSL